MVRIRVILTGDTISRWDDIEFFEEDTAEEFNRVWLANSEYTLGDVFFESGLWHRRFTTEPAGLQQNADIAFNMRRTLGNTFFLTDGTGELNPAGFYQKYQLREDGAYAYDTLSGPRIQHSSGAGEPSVEPTRNGEFYVDSLGRTWVGLLDRHILTTDAAATSARLEFDNYVRSPVQLSDIHAQGGWGGFTWVFGLGNRDLIQVLSNDPSNIDEHRSWYDTWNLVSTRPCDGQRQLQRRHQLPGQRVWLGGFRNQQEAAEEASHIVSQAAYDAGTPIFYGHTSLGPNQGIRRLTTYTQGTVTQREDGHWVGPFAIIADIETIANDILDDAVKVVADEAAATADGDRAGVLYLFP